MDCLQGVDSPQELAQHESAQVRLEGHQGAQVEGKAQGPLAHRYMRDDVIDGMSGLVGHATTGTRWAESATPARERPVTQIADYAVFNRVE